jgi:hypothetical protein
MQYNLKQQIKNKRKNGGAALTFKGLMMEVACCVCPDLT